MGVKWRDEDAFSRLARQEREEHLGLFRGLLIGLALSLPVWGLVVWLVLR